MADKKISALPAATVPLAGTEVLPLVQGGTTDKVSVANLTSGRTIDFAGSYATNATAATFRGYSIGGADTVTEFGSLKMEVSTGVMRLAAGFTGWGGQLALSTDGVDRVTVSTAGNATLNTGNLVVGTAGKGIDFSANGGDVLTQYDEGTWTPVDASGAGLTFTVNYATYTRVGRLVILLGSIQWPVTANTNSTQIGGVPFTAVNQITGNISYTSGSTADVNYINGSTTALYLLRPGVNTTNAQMSGHSLVFSATYFV